MAEASTPTRTRRSSLLSLGRRSMHNGTPTVLSPTNGTSDGGGGGREREAGSSSAVPSPTRNTDNSTNGLSQTSPTTASGDPSKQVQDVLSSEIGISTLLHRLKQSVSSAKEFSTFLRKRSTIENEHANSLKRLAHSTTESMLRTEHLGGSFGNANDELMIIHDRLADNGSQFAQQLHDMCEELAQVATTAERSRKHWKQQGLAAEQRFVDVMTQMKKSQHKYHGLAEEYDRARTGDPYTGRAARFGIRTRNTAQHEEDLLRKLQAADQDYQGKVQLAQQERADLLSQHRPEAIRALQDTVKECDSAIMLQMQKFASFNEKLLLSNGLSISPLKDQKGAGPDTRSMREIVLAVDSQQDFDRYVGSHSNRVPPQAGEPTYERHQVLTTPAPSAPQPMSGANPSVTSHQTYDPPPGPPPQQLKYAPGSTGSASGRTDSFQPSSPAVQSPYGQQQPQSSGLNLPGPIPLGGPRPPSRDQGLSPPPGGPQHERNFSASSQPGHPGQSAPQQWRSTGPGAPQQVAPESKPNLGSNNNSVPPTGPPQLGALSFQDSKNAPGYVPNQDSQLPPQPQQKLQQQQSQQHPPYQQSQQSPPFQHQQQQQQQQQSFSQAGQGQGPPPPQQQYSHQQQQGPFNMPPPSTIGAAPPGRNSPAQTQVQRAPPSRPVFGVPLQQLYERDGLAVPMVVYQCIQAVDLYGLTVEGIYRLSGSASSITRLRDMFDQDSSQPGLDFRNPENFFHDVNSVAGLLKSFLRDLPDPLLTQEHYGGFVEAAKHEDDTVRRDSLHAIINSLPDPHYATLRAVSLHLYRIIENSQSNRMNCQNLAIVFGPTLMCGAAHATSSIADAGWQIKVVETILENTYQIFDDD